MSKDPFSEINYQPPEELVRLKKNGSKRQYRFLGTDIFFEKLDAFIKENENECYSAYMTFFEGSGKYYDSN